ncbi:MAG: hypothetical protein L6R39_006989, partial [Caloplaca ligustica]
MAAAVGSMSLPRAQNGFIPSFFTRRPVDAVTSIPTSIDEDGSRRKRRKTESPRNEPEDVQGKAWQSKDGRDGEATSADHPSSQPDPAMTSTPNSRLERVTDAIGANSLANDRVDRPGGSSLSAFHDVVLLKDTTPGHAKPKAEPKARKRKTKSVTAGPMDATESLSSRGGTSTDKATAPEDPVGPQELAHSSTLPSKKRIKSRPNVQLRPPTTLEHDSRTPQDDTEPPPGGTSAQVGSKKIIRARADGKLASPKAPKPAAKVQVEETGYSISPQKIAVSTVCASEGQTMPQKLMKVRSDGRLVSPKSETNIDGAQPKRRGRPRKHAEAFGQSLVVIKYGATDDSRIAVGQRIQEILAGPQTLLSPQKPARPASKPTECPKATHPFFLGKPLQKPQTDLHGHKDSKKIDPESTGSGHRCSASPTKTKSPSKAASSVNGGSLISLRAPPPNAVFHSGPRLRAFPGAHDPIWPPLEMVHVRPPADIETDMLPSTRKQSARGFEPAILTKLKQIKATITGHEEVLRGCRSLVKTCITMSSTLDDDPVLPKSLRIPQRKVMSGHDLQQLYSQRNSFKTFTSAGPRSEELDELSQELYQNDCSHPALARLFNRIATSRTAFDRFECETQDWNHKYGPTETAEILQSGSETSVLRDWLRSLTVNSVARRDRKTEDDTKVLKRLSAGVTRKKRKRAEEMEGFMVSSDEEANEMDELDDDTFVDSYQSKDPRGKKSVVNAREAAKLAANPDNCEKSANAVVLSGPSGCGKTAAVHAVAKELGFEVFEINAGSRRSGKDIFDKVGDMSRNHLVNHSRTNGTEEISPHDGDLSRMDDALKQDIESGRQGTMNAFLQPGQDKKKPSTHVKHADKKRAAETKPKQRVQKQSVILLEEVDVLFDDDKQFWATALELIVQSKRPVVMTCTDESVLPLDNLPLFGILRFRPPPVELAAEYLSLLAANEGHLLPREAISTLYTVKANDLRASITELQFFCQLAIGDTKGGLEWMLDQPSAKDDQDSMLSRVISDGTYLKGMGWGAQQVEPVEEDQLTDSEIDTVLSLCNGWDIDVAATDDFLPGKLIRSLLTTNRLDSFQHLETLDLVCDALSAADTLHHSNFRSTLTVPLDVSAPEVSEKDRMNYTEGSTLLQADPFVDHSAVSDSIAAALRASARRSLLAINPANQIIQPMGQQYIINNLPSMIQACNRPKPVTPQTLSHAFTPLSKPSRGSLAGKPPSISTFDSPLSTIVSDIAPYVRSIVAYDLRLEEQRRQLEMASQTTTGREGKRIRTTRASRAALEGG